MTPHATHRAPSPSSRSLWIAPMLLIVLGSVAYSNSLHGPFIFDDIAAIVKNPQICSLNPFKYPPLGPTTITGRPVLILTFAADYAIARLHVEIYHATNLLIHLLAALFLFGILRRTLSRGEIRGIRTAQGPTWLAALIAALWLVHPLNTMSVTFIVQRAESLAGLFLLASFYFLIRAERGSNWWGLLAVIACGLGMASKEMVAAFPFLAILYDRAFMAGTFKEALRHRWKIYAGMAATWVFILLSLKTGRRGTMVGFHLGISPMEYARTELNVMARYLRMVFWPSDLSLDYCDWPLAQYWSDVQPGGWLVLTLIAGTLIALISRPRLGFLGAWFFLILAPTSSFLPIMQEAAAEQRMYLPLAAVLCVVVAAVWSIVWRWSIVREAAGLAACLAIVVLARLTMDRNEQFADNLTIWTDTVAKRPGNPRARLNLGEAWAQINLDYPENSQEAMAAAAKAAEQFRVALALDPHLKDAVFALGQSLDRSGDPAAAEDLYTRALPKFPNITGDLLAERGNLRARRQDWPDAKADFLAAIAADPANFHAHYLLGVLYQQIGDFPDAKKEFAATIALSPNFRDAAARLKAIQTSSRPGTP